MAACKFYSTVDEYFTTNHGAQFIAAFLRDHYEVVKDFKVADGMTASKSSIQSTLHNACEHGEIGQWPIDLESWRPKAQECEKYWGSFAVSDHLCCSLLTLTW